MYRGMVISAPLVIVTSGKFVFGIEVDSGMTRWAYALKNSPCRIVITSDRVFIAGDGELAGLEYATGKQVFHVRTTIAPDPTMLVDSDRIYIGAQGRVACYGMFGERHWINDLGTSQGVGFGVPGLSQQVDLKG